MAQSLVYRVRRIGSLCSDLQRFTLTDGHEGRFSSDDAMRVPNEPVRLQLLVSCPGAA